MKNKAVLLASFLTSVMLLSVAAFAAGPFEITITTDKPLATPGDVLKATAAVKNPFGSAETADVFFSGENIVWLTVPTSSLTLNAGTTTSFDFFVTPAFGAQPKTHNYTVRVVSRSFPEERFGETIFFYFVGEREVVQIVELEAARDVYRPGETAVINIKLKNTGTKEARNWTATLSFQGYPQASRVFELPSVDVNQQIELVQEVEFPQAAKGRIVGSLEIVDDKQRDVSSRGIAFTIEETALFDTRRSEGAFILFNTVTRAATNIGNKQGVVELTESVPGALAWMYTFSRPPDEVMTDGTYVWACDLEPGESCAVELRVNYWIAILIIAGILVGAGVAYRQLSRPAIKKRVTKRGGVWKVHLEISNRSRDPIEGVEIIDHVPGIAKLGSEFSIEPHATKKLKDGVAVVWKLGTLKPKEERVMTYEIRPVLAVIGGFDLPGAKMSAKSAQGVPIAAYSEKAHVG